MKGHSDAKRSGDSPLLVLLLPERIAYTNRSTQAHIWHTRRCRETNLPGVLEELSLISKSVP